MNFAVTIKALLNVEMSLRNCLVTLSKSCLITFSLVPPEIWHVMYLFSVNSWTLMLICILIEFYYFLSWIYAITYFEKFYGSFQWSKCIFSTVAGFSSSQVHLVILDFARDGPRHVLREFIPVHRKYDLFYTIIHLSQVSFE